MSRERVRKRAETLQVHSTARHPRHRNVGLRQSRFVALGGAGLPAYAFPSALGTAGQVLTVNPAGTALIWTTPA